MKETTEIIVQDLEVGFFFFCFCKLQKLFCCSFYEILSFKYDSQSADAEMFHRVGILVVRKRSPNLPF